MKKILTGQQMKKVDQRAIEELKIPDIILMENAGKAVSEKILEIIDGDNLNVLVICGKGKNGGDGHIAAKHLSENSVQTTVVSIEDPCCNIERLTELISYADIVVDAIFGVGLKGEVKGFYREVIDLINNFTEGRVVSVDIPSGVNADTGEIMGCAVIADHTITFHSPKTGLYLYPGAEFPGEIAIVPIGIPDYLTEDKEFNTYLITDNYVRSSMPIRPPDSHKGTFGKVFNIAGCPMMPGAAYMCSMSSLLVGAGYSTLATPEPVIPIVASKTPELIYAPFDEASMLEASAKNDVVLIGPGLGEVDFMPSLIQQLVNRGDKVLIDGGGLNYCSVFPINSVITPHPTELSRLMKEPLKDKLTSAREAAERFNTTVVLKGANTVIAEPNGNAYINTTGNSGLATAGSGDVLSGMIAGFIAQGASIKDAAILGVYLHGLAANIALNDINEYSLTAGKLMEYIPKAINTVIKGG